MGFAVSESAGMGGGVRVCGGDFSLGSAGAWQGCVQSMGGCGSADHTVPSHLFWPWLCSGVLQNVLLRDSQGAGSIASVPGWRTAIVPLDTVAGVRPAPV